MSLCVGSARVDTMVLRSPCMSREAVEDNCHEDENNKSDEIVYANSVNTEAERVIKAGYDDFEQLWACMCKVKA